uniref:3'-5' exoribonuclease Rv2179c-like domain-containing protein n=1 Tax=viral metagenome TaxID=1070528 RepID=A0A6C0JQE9_9ZZZZ
MDIPWKFWMERDLRTILDIGNVTNRSLPQNNMHHALYDAYRQVIGLQRAIKNIK